MNEHWLNTCAETVIKIADNEKWKPDDMTRNLAEQAIEAVKEIRDLRRQLAEARAALYQISILTIEGGWSTPMVQIAKIADAATSGQYIKTTAERMLQAQLEKVRTALLKVEWVSDGDPVCPWCGNYEWCGHLDNCDRQEALKGGEK